MRPARLVAGGTVVAVFAVESVAVSIRTVAGGESQDGKAALDEAGAVLGREVPHAAGRRPGSDPHHASHRESSTHGHDELWSADHEERGAGRGALRELTANFDDREAFVEFFDGPPACGEKLRCTEA